MKHSAISNSLKIYQNELKSGCWRKDKYQVKARAKVEVHKVEEELERYIKKPIFVNFIVRRLSM